MNPVVLWLFFSLPWNLGPIPMSPGWYSAFVYFSMRECREALPHMNRIAVCLEVNEKPHGEMSRALQRVRLHEQ